LPGVSAWLSSYLYLAYSLVGFSQPKLASQQYFTLKKPAPVSPNQHQHQHQPPNYLLLVVCDAFLLHEL